jgi:hypothetical protein
MLMISTFGCYLIYYLIVNHRIAQRRLAVQVRPWWAWFGLVVPFLNAYLVYSAFSAIGRRIELSGGGSRRAVLTIAVLLGVVNATWRLPDPWWFIFSVSGAPLLSILQSWLWRAERNDNPGLTPTTSVWEVLTIIVGLICTALVGVGMATPSASS